MTDTLAPLLALHVAGGTVAVLAGYGALLARKGGRFHRAVGRAFVAGMLVMALGALAVALAKGRVTQVVTTAFVVYLVGTAVTTVAPGTPRLARLDRALRLAALPLALAFAVGGVARLTVATVSQGGVPARSIAAASFLNALVMLLAWRGDVRVARGGALHGPARVRRHLWRMCFATFVASASFFLGQTRSLPEPLRVVPAPTLLAVLPLILMGAYLWRYRDRRRRGWGAPARGVRLWGLLRVGPQDRG